MDRAKLAVVTGATQGIGKAVAQGLVADGYDLAICARSAEDLTAFSSEVAREFPERVVLSRPTDVSDKKQLRQFAEMIGDRWDTVDVLVNNAGIFIPGEILKEEDGTLEKTMATNLYSAYYLTRYLYPLLVRSPQAHIFNICSVASLLAYPDGGSYCISKFAMRGMSMVLREEMKQQGIKVTSVYPGATWSRSWQGADYPESRLMQASDIAESVMSALRMGPSAVVEEILIRPQLGDL